MTTDMKSERSIVEELRLGGEELVATVKQLIHEGNIRRIIIKNEEGKVVLEIPLTVGVAGAILLPTLAAVGAVAALVTDCTILVERVEKEEEPIETL